MGAVYGVGLDQLTDISKLEHAQSKDRSKNQGGIFQNKDSCRA